MTDTDQAARADIAKRLVWRVTSDNGQPVYPGGSNEFRKDVIAAADEITRLRAERDAAEWQPMSTEPRDGCFRLYGLHVKNRSGFRWFEAHYVALGDDGQMVDPSGDPFIAWSYDDFEVWADAPSPPPAEGAEK